MGASTDSRVASESLEIEWLGNLARQRVRDSASRIAEMQRRAEDRDDLAGVKLLLRTLSLMATQTQSLIQDRLDLAGQAKKDERGHHLSSVRTALVLLEQALGRSCEALVAPPERDVAALVQPYVRLARNITGNSDTELIFESGESLGYSVWADVFEDVRYGVDYLAPGLGKMVKELPPLALVTYPGRADQETLLHSVIAHEVTHLALAEIRAKGPNQIVKAFESEIENQGLPDREIDRLDHWLNEFLADALALRIVGPAFFFGLLENLMPTHEPDPPYGPVEFEEDEVAAEQKDEEGDPEDEDDLSHPPPSWRFERLQPFAEEFFTKTEGRRLGEGAKVFEKILELVPRPADRTSGSIEQRDYTLLNSVIERIDLDEIVGDATYPKARFWRDVPLVWEKLEQDIAPVERIKGRRILAGPAEDLSPDPEDDAAPLPQTEWSQALDWRSILNGGYLHFLHGSLLAPPATDDAERRRRERGYVNSMIRGAIELSELHRRMIELKGQFDDLNDLKPGA